MRQLSHPLGRMRSVYVAAALTNAPEEFHKRIEDLKGRLRPHLEVLDFSGLDAPSAQVAFEHDIGCVRMSDLVVADVTYPSIGLGVEFGVAYSLKKSIITIAEADAEVSRFVFGYVSPTHFTYRYRTIDEAAQFILDKVGILFDAGYRR